VVEAQNIEIYFTILLLIQHESVGQAISPSHII